jgi:phosphoribosylanthranilate isomerase
MTEIKFCGLRTGPDVAAAVQAGARWTGFVLFPPSPRHLDPQGAGELAHLAHGTETVAVTVDASDELLEQIRDAMKPDWIQVHGDETPERVLHIRQYAKRGVWKALPVSDVTDLALAKDYEGVADRILFDSRAAPGASRPGGWGQGYDYSILQNLQISVPWVLSGGLSASNVAQAVAASGATAVDVSSGIETAPGVKSVALMSDFAAALMTQPAI